MRWKRRIAGAVWRALAPFLAVALVAVPLAWVVERRALQRQGAEVMAAAQSVWDGVAAGHVLDLFEADGRLPPAIRAEPMRRARCREEPLGDLADGITGQAVLCLTEDGRGKRYLAVGLAWTDAAPVQTWLTGLLGDRLPTLRGWMTPPEQGVLLYEEFWP